MSKRLKVLYFANGFPSEASPWKTIYNLRTVKQLSEHADVTVFTLRSWRPGRRMVDCYEYDGVVVHRIALPSVPFASRGIPFSDTGAVHGLSSSLAIRLARNYMPADLGSFDLVHAVSTTFNSWVAGEWCRIANKPFVTQAIGTDVNVILPKVLFAPSIKRSMSRAVGAICNSKHLAASYSQLFPNAHNVSVIYRGTDLSLFAPPAASDLKRGIGFLYAGGFPLQDSSSRLSLDVKGGLTILNAWKSAEADLIAADARLYIAGPGTANRLLAKWHAELQHPDRVAILGTISPRDMPMKLKLADVVLVPSEQEGLPNLGMEAMASGRPVFGSNVGGIPELVRDGITGRLLPPGDSVSWAAAMLSAEKSKDALLKMGMESRRRIEAMFNGQEYGSNVYSFYSAIMN